jgi:hypothetical protein
MNRIVAFGLCGPIIIALLGTSIYLPSVIYLSGQTGVGVDTYQVAFVLFLIMGLLPEWLNLVVVAAGATRLRWSAAAGVLGGAAMAYLPRSLGLPHENLAVCAVMALVASSACWWLSVRNSAKGLHEQV